MIGLSLKCFQVLSHIDAIVSTVNLFTHEELYCPHHPWCQFLWPCDEEEAFSGVA